MAFTMLASGSAALAGGSTTGADVQISGSASMGSPAPNQPFSYTFQVKNNGPDTATAVGFTDPLPAGTGYNYATVNGYSAPCGAAANSSGNLIVSCSLSDIAKGSQSTVVVSVNAPGNPGTYANTATATSTASDPQPSNNSVTVTIQVKAVTCPLPAGQTTLGGLVMWKDTNSQGMFENFDFQGNDGVNYYVVTNFYDGTRPLTSVINLLCKQVPNSFIQTGNSVTVTAIPGDPILLPGQSTPTPVLYASVVQVPYFFDKI